MLKVKLIVVATLVTIFALVLSARAAVTLEINGSGIITGARNVDVNGTFYDVQFVDGSCVALFSGCTSTSDFPFHNLTDAMAAGQALLDQVLLDVPQGNFDTNVGQITGCTFLFECITYIPYDVTGSNIDFASANNYDFILGFFPEDYVAIGNSIPTDLETGSNIANNFAIFVRSPVPTPEPGTLVVLCIGLAGVALSRWSRGNRTRPAVPMASRSRRTDH